MPKKASKKAAYAPGDTWTPSHTGYVSPDGWASTAEGRWKVIGGRPYTVTEAGTLDKDRNTISESLANACEV